MGGFKRILIANRGEIAVRVIRTLRELDIASIAIFSEPDRAALHVLMADEAYPIGPGPARESYLDLERVIETALRVRADAIHPGYGFFAENAEFAAACEVAGIVFIGPAPRTITALGDKLAARAVAEAAGVPVVPGTGKPLERLDEARAFGKQAGFPLLLKAAAGGGGKGMRLVREPAELEAAWSLTRGEALAAFGDDRIYVERAIERARHIEVQILADARGNLVALGERECSVQRRHQKLIEETPSVALDATGRAAICDAACRVARQVSYRGAGTVEFLLDDAGRFYFLEVNTRLQVEHPVTEMVTGLDLVAEQVRIAEGEPLSFGDRPPGPRGWSFEARIIAEDPLAGFMPSIGRIERVRMPAGPGVRNDAGIYRGYEVPVHYDSLLSKLIVWGEDRERARRRLLRALGEFVLEGPKTNLVFQSWLASHPEFAAGRLSTRFLEEHFDPRSLAPRGDALEVAVLAAALHAREERLQITLPESNGGVRSAWKWAEPAALRGTEPAMKFWITLEGREAEVEFQTEGDRLMLEIEGRSLEADFHRLPDGEVYSLLVDGRSHEVRVSPAGPLLEVTLHGAMVPVEVRHPLEKLLQSSPRASAAGGGETVSAPMPGLLVAFRVKPGDRVEVGQSVCVVEAMKMQNELSARQGGVVTEILVAEKSSVSAGQPLIRIKALA